MDEISSVDRITSISVTFQIRNFALSICSWWCWILGFLIIKFYPYIESLIGLWGCMLFFAVTCCFCGFFTVFVLPETKGRNIEEIAQSIETTNDKK